MDQNIKDFVQLRRIALVGASRSGKKFGNSITSELTAKGYQVSLVHPEAKEINGQPCYPNLAALKGQVDGVLICVPPRQAAQVIREAAEAGIRHIWLQQGAQSPEALAAAREHGIDAVPGKCILMYAEPVQSLHRFHRAIARIFGQV